MLAGKAGAGKVFGRGARPDCDGNLRNARRLLERPVAVPHCLLDGSRDPRTLDHRAQTIAAEGKRRDVRRIDVRELRLDALSEAIRGEQLGERVRGDGEARGDRQPGLEQRWEMERMVPWFLGSLLPRLDDLPRILRG